MAETIEETLKTRGNVHGDFVESAVFKDAVGKLIRLTPNYDRMGHACRQAMFMIVEKMGRILYGNPTFADHWHDISGYAKLIDDAIIKGKLATTIIKEATNGNND